MRHLRKASSLDAQISAYMRRVGAPQIRTWLLIAQYGMYVFIPAACVLIALNRESWRTIFISLSSSYLTLLVLQMLIGRERPPFKEISGYRMWVHTYSFPSGHATESACLAVTITIGLLNIHPLLGLAFGVVLGILAGLICLARVIVGVHYIADVLAGCVLGATAAVWLTKIL